MGSEELEFQLFKLLPELQEVIIEEMTPLSRALLTFTSASNFLRFQEHQLNTQKLLEQCAIENQMFIALHILTDWVHPGFQLDRPKFFGALAKGGRTGFLRFVFIHKEFGLSEIPETQRSVISREIGRFGRVDFFLEFQRLATQPPSPAAAAMASRSPAPQTSREPNNQLNTQTPVDKVMSVSQPNLLRSMSTFNFYQCTALQTRSFLLGAAQEGTFHYLLLY